MLFKSSLVYSGVVDSVHYTHTLHTHDPLYLCQSVPYGTITHRFLVRCFSAAKTVL